MMAGSRRSRESKRERQSAMRELVTRHPISSQQELVELLAARGFSVTQATVSRDIAELGLAKVARADRHIYASPEDLALVATATDVPLRRLLGDLPLTVRRSGLTLLLITSRGHGQRAVAGDRRIDPAGPGRHARGREHGAGAVRGRGAIATLASPPWNASDPTPCRPSRPQPLNAETR